ncbi:hypothetical protein [Nocardioides sp. Arc9.136]|uniref:hypothetical protein n=1 Tax=Nocardioides sp. Arc9.136 TaxID=2996826 RepID=UPI002665A895|nr:hypothetical protein [Nocardioides sp. Arc9.136]WKN47796.1 hypothetical protein OSR43_17365 [Nocardioides sp. Arc9.136]
MSVGGMLRRAVRYRWAVVLAILVPAVVVGVGAVETRPDSSVAVSVVAATPESAELVSADAVRLALGRYAVALTSPDVLDQVATTTGADRSALEDAVAVTVSQDAGNLAVRATMADEDQAVAVARAVAEVAVTMGEEDPLANATVLSGARVEPPGPLGSPRVLELVLVLAALVVALAVAYALEAVRPRVRTGGDAAVAAGGPVLGSLPAFTGPWPRRTVASDKDILTSARALRSGWTASAGTVPPGPVVLVGAEPEAGATTVTFLLARTLCDRGESTLVLDLDLDEAGLTALMETPGRYVLDDVLAERASLADAVVHEGDVAVLGAVPLRSADDVLDRRLPEALKQADDQWDVVLCDTTPLDAGESSEIVAGHAASAVVVVRLGTPVTAVRRTAARLARLGVPVRGVVLNRATRDQAEAPALAEAATGTLDG